MGSITGTVRGITVMCVCVCCLAHRYKEALPIMRYQSLASPSPHLEAALNKIEGNCDVLPLLKFCTNKPILALLLRQFFFGGGKGGVSPKERV